MTVMKRRELLAAVVGSNFRRELLAGVVGQHI